MRRRRHRGCSGLTSYAEVRVNGQRPLEALPGRPGTHGLLLVQQPQPCIRQSLHSMSSFRFSPNDADADANTANSSLCSHQAALPLFKIALQACVV